MLESSLTAEISHTKEKLGAATKAKAAATETQASAEGDLAETTKTKAADEEYSATLKTECETAASEWAERQKSAKEEMAAIEKAKEILSTGVTALTQVSVSQKSIAFDEDGDENSEKRQKLA